MAFTYPLRRHSRRYHPRGYREYQSHKPWLRDEFSFRCVYCLWRERWCADGDQMFSVDHLWPRMTHPERLCDYDNLVYACCQCNALKQASPPVLDPCEEAFGHHLELHADGSVRALTEHGAAQIALCRLNRPRLQEARRRMLELFTMLAASESEAARALLHELQGFPDNLPQLAALRPPHGITSPEAISNSYYAKRQRGELPATY